MTKPESKPKDKPDLIDRQPPFDLQAEAGVLGSVILLPSCFDEVHGRLTVEDFYDDSNGLIFAACCGLQDQKRPIDMTILTDWLKDAGKWEAVGGAKYLSRIINSVAVPAHAVYYADIVAEKAVYRRLIMAAMEILKDAYDEADDAASLVAKADTLLAGVTSRVSSQHQIVSIGHAAAKVVRTLSEERAGSVVNRAMWGLPSVDEALGPIMPGEMCVIAARPGMGKTAFAQHVLRHSARRDRPSLLLSLEMTESEVSTREMCRIVPVDSRVIRRGEVGPADLGMLRNAAANLAGLPLYVWDPPKATMSQVRGVVANAVNRMGVRLVALDYIQLTSGDEKTRDQRREQISQISKGIKRMAKEFEIPVVALCQLNREAEKERPTMAMLRECGAIEEDADWVLFLHQEDKRVADRRTLIAGKFRHGATGEITLRWDGPRTEFSDLGDRPGAPQKEIF